jgi:hypothetical protein
VHGAPEGFYVFGDSYTDTGNGGNSVVPYGITWPGYPHGRGSDGRIQVDYFGEDFQPSLRRTPIQVIFWLTNFVAFSSTKCFLEKIGNFLKCKFH